ncbi:hypothetical protein [Ensifer aridi]|uniref:hypothetical protein n=1 Tax=Ensifer aridi TaxID=1708715 RepID=UPI0009C18B0B|nr:hypothetical protein [Ensifer aridi]
MNLLRAVHATKVLVLAFALAMPVSVPVRADDNSGFGNVETRTRHIRLKHRLPHHAWRRWHGGHRFFAGRRRHRSVMSGFDDFPAFSSQGLPEVQTRTRHVRLKHRWPQYARRKWKHGAVIIINGGGYGSADYGSYGSYDFPTPIPDIGTYAGGLSAFREEGNGIYFSRDGGYRYAAEDFVGIAPPSKRAKIIIVSPQTNASACPWEHGVCVVRP